MIDKLIVARDKVTEADFTSEEIAQQELERQQAAEQALLDSLIPAPEEIEQAEFEIKSLNLLIELGVI